MSKSNDNNNEARGRGRGVQRSRGRAFRGQNSQLPRGGGRGRGALDQNPISSASLSRPPAPKPGVSSSKRQMELIPAVSRSSGLDKDGDSLKNPQLQEEYLTFIEEKLEKVLERYENLNTETDDQKKHRLEEQENMLILFRKLREGLSSSGRIDDFSIEVYERSLYLSVLFASQKHTTAIIPALLNDVYRKAYSTPSLKNNSSLSTDDAHHHRHLSILISLIQYLNVQYPSQILYHQQLGSISNDWIPLPTQDWLKALTHALRSGNYHKFGILTDEGRVRQLVTLPLTSDQVVSRDLHNKLAGQALTIAIDTLRTRARDATWKIMRSAFRELWFEEPFDTRHWLCRSLTFDTGEPLDEFNQWLSGVEKSGEIRRKEGTQGRWIVAKVQ